MIEQLARNERGQAMIEYLLLLMLLVVGSFAALGTVNSTQGAAWDTLRAAVAGASGAATQESQPTKVEKIVEDFLQRIQAFYDERGRWPRSWGDFAYTDIGLNPADWSGPVEGIYWGPNGQRIGLANKIGDTLEIYVDDLNGNTRHLVNGWNIWCYPGVCYYHTATPGNEVDISTLRVVDTALP